MKSIDDLAASQMSHGQESPQDTHADEHRSGNLVRHAVQQHEAALVRYAQSLVGNLDLARDIVQDTFLKLCRENTQQLDGQQSSALQPNGRLAAWLYTVCRNRAIDVLRKEKRMHSNVQDQLAVQDKMDGRHSPDADPATANERKDLSHKVDQLMVDLTDNQREVVRLKFQGGLSYQEISHITELSVSNVGYLIHTAIKRLREQLQTEIN